MNGILLVDKPAGYTSFKVVHKIKRHFNLTKVGHGGTLDPFATGLLVILIGKATKISATFLNDAKCYEGELVLGKETDTYDIKGKVVKEILIEKLDEEKVKKVFAGFQGAIYQKPPQYSAIKIGGRKAYKVARKGGYLDIPERQVNIYSLETVQIKQNFPFPSVVFKAKVSKGTYIRSLAHDIGQELKTGAYLSSLTRTASGEYQLKEANPLKNILKWKENELIKHLK